MLRPTADDRPIELAYSEPPPVFHRRAFTRIFIIAFGLIAAATGSWWGPPTWGRVQLLYWQHRCLTSRSASDTVVYDLQGSPCSTPATVAFGQYYARLSPPGTIGTGAAFLGPLCLANETRLVAVEVYPLPSGVRLGAAVFSIGSVWHRPAERARVYSPSIGFGDRPPDRIYAGQVDAADPSHFTIRVDDAAGRRIVDGWLQANDSVVLDLRP